MSKFIDIALEAQKPRLGENTIMETIGEKLGLDKEHALNCLVLYAFLLLVTWTFYIWISIPLNFAVIYYVVHFDEKYKLKMK